MFVVKSVDGAFFEVCKVLYLFYNEGPEGVKCDWDLGVFEAGIWCTGSGIYRLKKKMKNGIDDFL